MLALLRYLMAVVWEAIADLVFNLLGFQHVCAVVGYRGDRRTQLVSQRWTVRGCCVGHALPSVHVARGLTLGSETRHLGRCSGHPSPIWW